MRYGLIIIIIILALILLYIITFYYFIIILYYYAFGQRAHRGCNGVEGRLFDSCSVFLHCHNLSFDNMSAALSTSGAARRTPADTGFVDDQGDLEDKIVLLHEQLDKAHEKKKSK